MPKIRVSPDSIKLGPPLINWHTVDHLVALKFMSNAGITSMRMKEDVVTYKKPMKYRAMCFTG